MFDNSHANGRMTFTDGRSPIEVSVDGTATLSSRMFKRIHEELAGDAGVLHIRFDEPRSKSTVTVHVRPLAGNEFTSMSLQVMDAIGRMLDNEVQVTFFGTDRKPVGIDGLTTWGNPVNDNDNASDADVTGSGAPGMPDVDPVTGLRDVF